MLRFIGEKRKEEEETSRNSRMGAQIFLVRSRNLSFVQYVVLRGLNRVFDISIKYLRGNFICKQIGRLRGCTHLKCLRVCLTGAITLGTK